MWKVDFFVWGGGGIYFSRPLATCGGERLREGLRLRSKEGMRSRLSEEIFCHSHRYCHHHHHHHHHHCQSISSSTPGLSWLFQPSAQATGGVPQPQDLLKGGDYGDHHDHDGDKVSSVNGFCGDYDDQNDDALMMVIIIMNEPKAKDTTAKMTMTTTFVPSTSILPDFRLQTSKFNFPPVWNFR